MSSEKVGESLLKRRTFLLLAGTAALTAAGCSLPHTQSGEQTRPTEQHEQQVTAPTWEQDFSKLPDGPFRDPNWHHELDPNVPGYNDEEQAYTDRASNVRIEDGKLILEAHAEPYTYPGGPEQRSFAYTSGRIDTRPSFSFEYGKIEATMKLPKGKGTWPAFWLLSANQTHTNKLNPTDRDWEQPRFYMKDGELDIMEHYGHSLGMIEATAHTFSRSSEGHIQVDDCADRFHTYGLELTPDKVIWTLDGQPYYTLTKPSDNPDDWPFGNGNTFYVILNLAMGGPEGGGDIDPTSGPWRFEVMNVKYFEPTAS